MRQGRPARSHYVNANLSISPHATAAFLTLERQGAQGNYWATQIVREIRNLAGGGTVMIKSISPKQRTRVFANLSSNYRDAR